MNYREGRRCEIARRRRFNDSSISSLSRRIGADRTAGNANEETLEVLDTRTMVWTTDDCRSVTCARGGDVS
jgi:hypothetical protein